MANKILSFILISMLIMFSLNVQIKSKTKTGLSTSETGGCNGLLRKYKDCPDGSRRCCDLIDKCKVTSLGETYCSTPIKV